jgi:putative MATE family efflux protein
MASSAAKQDLGTGSIKKLLVQLAVPAVVAQIINLLYNIVDRIYIGHIPGIGASALTGVGLFTPILTLLTAFAMLFGSGGAPRAAISMGQGDNRTAERIMGNCFTLLVAASVVLTVVFYAAAPTLLRWFGASDATLPYAVAYGRIYILGSIFVLTVMGMNPFITTQGFAKISMLTTVIGALINIVLDPILIFVFDLGVSGAAIATVFSQAVSAVWILLFLVGKKTTLRLRRENLRLDPRIFLPCMALGVSTFVMMSTESLLSISFTTSLSRYGGDLAVGAMTVLTSISQLVTMILQGMCQGAQPIISFNYGAGKAARVKQTFRYLLTVSACYATLFWAAAMLFPQVFAGIFTSDTALVTYTTWAMRIYLACAFSNAFQMCCQQTFMALGQAKVSLLLACLRKLILLIPLIFILPHFFADKVFAVFLAEPVSDLLAATVTTITFLSRFNGILRRSPGNTSDN